MAASEREIAAALRWAAGGGQVPPEVWEGIQEAIRRPPPRRRFRPWMVATAVAVVGALVLALRAAPAPGTSTSTAGGDAAAATAGQGIPAAAPLAATARGALVPAADPAGAPGRLVAGGLAAGRSLGHGFRAGGLTVVLF